MKSITLCHSRPFLLVILLPTLLGAQKGSYVKFGETDLGGAAWLLYIVMAAVILIPAFYLIRSRSTASRPSKAARQKKAKVSEDFKQRAAALGFTVGESRTLERIATRLTPKTPHNLLVTGTGQDYLMADLDKRIARRQREASCSSASRGSSKSCRDAMSTNARASALRPTCRYGGEEEHTAS